MDVTVVAVDSPASASTTVHAVPFTPRSFYIFGTRSPGTQGLAAAFRVGVDDLTRRASYAVNPGNFGGHQADSYASDGYSFLAMRTQGLNELMLRGYVSAVTSGSFSVTWDFVLVATGVRFYVVVFGGSELNGYVSHWDAVPNSTTPVTGIPFRPVGLLGLRSASGTPLLPGDGTSVIGYGSDGCGQAAVSSAYGAFTNPLDAYSRQTLGDFLNVMGTASSGAIIRRNVLNSIQDNGFTYTNTTPAGNAGRYAALAINGCAVNVKVFNQPLVIGAQAVPITMGAGKLAILASFGKPANANAVSDWMISLGAGCAARQSCVWAGALAGTGSGSELANSVQDDDVIGIVHNPTGNFASTQITRVFWTSFTAGFCNLNWTMVDGTAREWVLCVIGDDLGSGPCGGGVIPPPPPPVGCQPFSIGSQTAGMPPGRSIS